MKLRILLVAAFALLSLLPSADAHAYFTNICRNGPYYWVHTYTFPIGAPCRLVLEDAWGREYWGWGRGSTY